MENEFIQVMSERTDEELIKIVTVDKEKYQTMAIDAAKAEIKKRNIDETIFFEIEQESTIEKEKIQKVDSNIANTEVRLLNYIIDTIASFILAMIVTTIYQFIFPNSNSMPSALTPMFLLFFSVFSYYVILELKFQKTLGKFVTKTKVVRLNGEVPNQSDIVLRTFCRLIPFDHISYLFMKNGFHDTLSKTKVIKDKSV